MGPTSNKLGGEQVGKGNETINEVWRQGSEAFQSWSFEGGGECLTHNNIIICVQVDVSDIDLDVLVGVSVPNVAF